MKAGWSVKSISKFAKTSAGGTPLKSRKDFYEDGTIPWIRSGEVCKRDILKSEKFITRLGLEGSSAKTFPINSVLIAMYGATAAQSGILRFEAATNQAVCAVLPNKSFVPEFLYYFMLLEKQNLIDQAIGNAQPNISQSKIRKTKVPLPPLEEQKRIVAVLDAAFEGLDRARAHTEANLQNVRDLFESGMHASFVGKWPLKRFDEVCVLHRGFDLPKRIRQQGEFDLVTSSGINDTHSEFKVEGPGVATGRSGSIGKVFYIEGRFWPLNTALYVKQFHNNVPKFIWYFLRNFDLSRFSSGAGVPTLNRNDVHGERVSVPADILEQGKIVMRLDALEIECSKLEAEYKSKLTDLDDLRQSLLQKAFAGELT